MEVTIKLDDVKSNSDTTQLETSNTILNRLLSKVIFYMNKYNVKSDLIVNGMVGSMLQDSVNFSVTSITTNLVANGENYIIGKIFDRNVVINPYKLWTDYAIDIIIDKSIIRRNKIHKIMKLSEPREVLEKIHIEQAIVDILI